jgi:hypothetical protein
MFKVVCGVVGVIIAPLIVWLLLPVLMCLVAWCAVVLPGVAVVLYLGRARPGDDPRSRALLRARAHGRAKLGPAVLMRRSRRPRRA